MSSLFSTDTASKYLRKQQKYGTTATKSALSNIKTDPYTKALTDASAKYGSQGLQPTSYKGPSYGIGIDSSGKINANRTAGTQGWIDTLLGGTAADEGGFNSLIGNLDPTFGRLTTANDQRFDDAKRKAVGDLREQMAKRRVLGSSFAEQNVNSVGAEYDRMKEQAAAENAAKSLELQSQALQARSAARIQNVSQALSQIQFEGNVGASLIQSTQTNLMNMSELSADLLKLASSLGIQGQLAKGQISGNLSNTTLGSFGDYANLESQEKAGPAQFLGQLGGMALSGMTGGATGGIGGLFSGGGQGYSYNSSATGMPWQSPTAAQSFDPFK